MEQRSSSDIIKNVAFILLFLLVFIIPLIQASLIGNVWYNTLTFLGIIPITNANHLNSDRVIISDIYNQVKSLDDVWSEEIGNNEYVRVIFNHSLTNKNDITIFPMVISGTPIIEVYEMDEIEKIAEFNPVVSNDYNKIYLTNLQGNQDTFDLRVVGGNVKFDYIVDPLQTVLPNSTVNKAWNGSLNDNSLGIETSTTLNAVDYQKINRTDGNLYRPPMQGDAGSDGYVFVNFTIPIGIYDKINASIVMNVSITSGTMGIALWDFELGEWVKAKSITGTNTLTSISYNLTPSNFSIYVSGNEIRVMAFDNSNAASKSSVDSILLDISYTTDSNAPDLNITFPLNNTNWTTDPDVNYIASDANGLFNCWYSNDTYLKNTSLASCTTNITGVVWGEGQHNVSVWANDTFGNVNKTDVTFRIIVDRNAPNINFTFPTPGNGTLTSNSSIWINVSTSDVNEHSVFVDWNRSLVGWWSFDSYNTTGVYDNSTYNHLARLTGTTINNITSGTRGKGFNNSYLAINVSSTSTLNLTEAMTLMLWIKPDTQTGTQKRLIEKGYYTTSYVLGTGADGTHDLTFWLANVGVIDTADVLTDNIWQHVALSFNGTNATMYVNGIVVGTGNFSGTVPGNTDPLYFGSSPDSGSSYSFKGGMDEIMIFSRALSQQEIIALYNATSGTGYSNNFTNFSDGSYNYTAYAIDSSGNVNKTEQRIITINSDLNYPQFSTYWDNNASLVGTGTGKFNVTVTSTNGSVYLNVDGNAIRATNHSDTPTVFNATYTFSSAGTYAYNWTSYGNGILTRYNISDIRSYTVNASPQCSPTINIDWIISDTQICDGVEVTTGTGKIVITTGSLYLINKANVSTSELNISKSGDKIFINRGSELKIT